MGGANSKGKDIGAGDGEGDVPDDYGSEYGSLKDDEFNQVEKPLEQCIEDDEEEDDNFSDQAFRARCKNYIDGKIAKPSIEKLEDQEVDRQGTTTTTGSTWTTSQVTSEASLTHTTASSASVMSKRSQKPLSINSLLPTKISIEVLSPAHSLQKLGEELRGMSNHSMRAGSEQGEGEGGSRGEGSQLVKKKKEKVQKKIQHSQMPNKNQFVCLTGPSRGNAFNGGRGVTRRTSSNNGTRPPKNKSNSSNHPQSQDFGRRQPPCEMDTGRSYSGRPLTRTLSKSSVRTHEFTGKKRKEVVVVKKPATRFASAQSFEDDSSRQDTAKKLKVRGLRNFVDTHKPTAPPLWAKQFPCRSRFHPDQYLYDFEGFNAPKRPVSQMGKCPKKCGRCSRCGVYVGDICQKCSMCPNDCKCPKPMSQLPTPEHFLSQLLGPNWSQTQAVEVNGHPLIPDKPRVNLHDASSNNPLKISNNETKEGEEKKVMSTGYDTYTELPTPPSHGYSSYPPPPMGYGYGYPPWPMYYPTYIPPPPPPVPPAYYGYPAPPPYKYQ